MITLKFVTWEILPSGQIRYRFRRKGKKVTLRGKPGSPEFHAHYTELLKGTVSAPGPVEGSIAWLAEKYLNSLEDLVKAGLKSPLTLKGHKHHLGRLVKEYGEMDMAMPRGKLIEFKDKFAKTPGAADNLIKSVSSMYKWAIERDIYKFNNPTIGIKKLNTNSSGFTPWVKSDFTKYFDTYEEGSVQWLALTLAIATTARRSDIVMLGADHEFELDGRMWLRWRQTKAPNRIVELPMSKTLFDATRGIRQTPYLRTAYGKPFTGAGFGIRFREWCIKAGVTKTLHGVRKGVSSLLPGQGSNSLELDVLLGHELNSDETKVYVAEAERIHLALKVIDRLDKLKL